MERPAGHPEAADRSPGSPTGPAARGEGGLASAQAWQRAEPRYLVTSPDDPREALHLYERRMAIEAFFRDCKRELGLRKASVRQAHRLDSLPLALLVAYLLLALLGLSGGLRRFKRLVLTHGQASFCWLAL